MVFSKLYLEKYTMLFLKYKDNARINVNRFNIFLVDYE